MIKHGERTVFESDICLKKIPDDRAFGMISLYSHYDSNILPYSGGILDQPHYYVEAMKIIKGAING